MDKMYIVKECQVKDMVNISSYIVLSFPKLWMCKFLSVLRSRLEYVFRDRKRTNGSDKRNFKVSIYSTSTNST